jgi:orotidine-5'-phosphate decarboxylase
MTFREKLARSCRRLDSALCVGLDPDPEQFPEGLPKDPGEATVIFNRAIIGATKDLAAAYKPNLAFYEALGASCYETLVQTLEAIPKETVTIADGKRGDIGNTARMYAKSVFEIHGFDAVTVNPYMGEDAIRPFLEYEGKGAILLCLTSNPSSADFQRYHDLYLRVAEKALQWDQGNIGLVVGAQHPDELRRIREIVGSMPILVPGVGTQGGSLEEVMEAGKATEPGGLLINVSRGILYASRKADFAEKSREEAVKLISTMRQSTS